MKKLSLVVNIGKAVLEEAIDIDIIQFGIHIMNQLTTCMMNGKIRPIDVVEADS